MSRTHPTLRAILFVDLFLRTALGTLFAGRDNRKRVEAAEILVTALPANLSFLALGRFGHTTRGSNRDTDRLLPRFGYPRSPHTTSKLHEQFAIIFCAVISNPIHRLEQSLFFGARLGNPTLHRENDGSLIDESTPSLWTHTSRGVVPHLTRDHISKVPAIRGIHIPFET
jgi:hypothetical protein